MVRQSDMIAPVNLIHQKLYSNAFSLGDSSAEPVEVQFEISEVDGQPIGNAY